MVTIELARTKHNILFHSPSSPPLTVKRGSLKNFAENRFQKQKMRELDKKQFYSGVFISTSTLTGTDSL
jgi:hypothetical protein